MDAPPCFTCGHNHWSRQPCIWDKPKADSMANKPQDVANTAKTMANRSDGMANSSTYRYRDADKRRKYQRDLMRNRRQKETRTSRA